MPKKPKSKPTPAPKLKTETPRSVQPAKSAVKNTSKTEDGSVVLRPTGDTKDGVMQPLDFKSVSGQKFSPKMVDGVVVMSAPEDRVAPATHSDALNMTDHLGKAVRDPTRQTIEAMMGRSVAAAVAILENMVKAKQLVSYKVLKNGEGFSGDFQTGRVQLLEVDGMLKDFQVG